MTRQLTYVFIAVISFACSPAENKTAKHQHFTGPDYLVTGYYNLARDSDKFRRQLSGTAEKYNLNPHPIITVENFISATLDSFTPDRYFIRIDLDEPGGQKWSEGTGKAIGDSLAIIVNNELIQVARVNAQITAPVTAINREGLTKSQARKYLADIKAQMKE